MYPHARIALPVHWQTGAGSIVQTDYVPKKDSDFVVVQCQASAYREECSQQVCLPPRFRLVEQRLQVNTDRVTTDSKRFADFT